MLSFAKSSDSAGSSGCQVLSGPRLPFDGSGNSGNSGMSCDPRPLFRDSDNSENSPSWQPFYGCQKSQETQARASLLMGSDKSAKSATWLPFCFAFEAGAVQGRERSEAGRKVGLRL